MAEKIVQKEEEIEPEVENDEVEATEEKQPEPQGNKAKTFTQEQVDRLIQNRLRKEKETSKTTIDSLTTDIEFYEAQMGKVVEAQTADWDEGMKTLFNALPVKERLQKLSDEEFMAKVRRKNVPPKTPKEEERTPAKAFTVRQII